MRDFQISFPALPTDSVRASSPPPYWLPTPFILASSYVPSHPPYPLGPGKGPQPCRATPFPVPEQSRHTRPSISVPPSARAFTSAESLVPR